MDNFPAGSKTHWAFVDLYNLIYGSLDLYIVHHCTSNLSNAAVVSSLHRCLGFLNIPWAADGEKLLHPLQDLGCGFFVPWMVFSFPGGVGFPLGCFSFPRSCLFPWCFSFRTPRCFSCPAGVVRSWLVFCGAAGVYCSLKGVCCSQRSGFVWKSERVFIVP